MFQFRAPRAIAGLSALTAFTTVACDASAQTAIQIYGIISAGIVSTSNQGGQHKLALDSGTMQPSRLGFKGAEDLGGGNSALFVLENGFSVDTGVQGQGGKLFGRQAYVGMKSQKLGTITLGRQYEEMAQQLWWSESGTLFGALGTRIGDNDNAFGTFRLNNSIRYQSPNFDGLSFAAQYALSESAGNSNNNSAYSVGASYIKENLRIAAVITDLHNPASATNAANGAVDNAGYGFSSPFITSPTTKAAVQNQKIIGLGAYYKMGSYQIGAGYSNVKFDYLDASDLKLKNVEVYAAKNLSENLLLGVGLIYTGGKYSANNSEPNYKQLNVGLDYFLSKRTDLYIVDSYQRAGGSAVSAQLFATQPSSSTNQNTLMVGIRHKF